MKKMLVTVQLACAALLFAQSAAADNVVRSFERMLTDSRAALPFSQSAATDNVVRSFERMLADSRAASATAGAPDTPALPADAASANPSADPLLPYFQAALWDQRPMPGKVLDAAAGTPSGRPL